MTPIHENEVQYENELYVASDTSIGGSGTKGNPLRTWILDGVFTGSALSGKSVRLHLGPGDYYVHRGIVLPELGTIAIVGSGEGKTRINLANNAGPENMTPGALRMISDKARWCRFFYARDFTLNGNWEGQDERLTNGNFKIQPLHVETIRGRVERVTVENWGANGKEYGEMGSEAFPLSLHTFPNDTPEAFYPVFQSMVGKEAQTFIEIVDCKVIKGNWLNGGYSTGIFVTTYAEQGNRQPFGVRKSLAASIRDCYVETPGGIGYGCARSENVEFVGNVAVNSSCGFNHDAGALRNLVLRNNQFLNCNFGINAQASPGNYGGVELRRNVITLSEPFDNKVLKRPEPFFWLRHSDTDVKAVGNHVALLGDPKHGLHTTLPDPWKENTRFGSAWTDSAVADDLLKRIAGLEASLETESKTLHSVLASLQHRKGLIANYQKALNELMSEPV